MSVSRLSRLAVSLLAMAIILGACPRLRAQQPAPPPPGVPDVLPDQIAIDFDDAAGMGEIASIAARVGINVTPASEVSSEDRLMVARVTGARMSGVLAALEQEASVEVAEPMSLLFASFVPNDPLYVPMQWHLKRVGAERGWEYSCGIGVTVAVIDTGVACFDREPFSRGTDLTGSVCSDGWDFVNGRAEAADDHGHGTHVAGTVAQATHNARGVAGLAPCARLMPLKVLNRQGWGTVVHVAQGVRFAADHGAQVINLSLGGRVGSAILRRAIEHAQARNVVVVAAAGNGRGALEYPAAFPGVIAVSALDRNDEIAWFSSRGPGVALAAPGVDVTQQTVCSAGRDRCELFGTFSGTSMAAPHVSAAAAQLVSLGVTRAASVRHALERAASPKPDRALYGAGILDAGAALASAHRRQVLVRLGVLAVLAAGVVLLVRGRRGRTSSSPLVWLGALLGATGLGFFLPWLGVLPRVGRWRWLLELLARPPGEWDLLLAAGWHRWLALVSCLPVVVLVGALYGVRALRPAIGGFALGSAALGTSLVLTGATESAYGAPITLLWLLGNAGICLWIARLSLDVREG